jgi:NADH-quinone oxidoreductase subunit F
MLEILDRIVSGAGRDGDIELLLELADTVTAAALCGLGKSAALPVISTIKGFRSEYETHIFEKKCPVGSCSKLKNYVIDENLCKGCAICKKACPVEAISGKVKEPFVIDCTKCIKCEACIPVCPFKAIKEG